MHRMLICGPNFYCETLCLGQNVLIMHVQFQKSFVHKVRNESENKIDAQNHYCHTRPRGETRRVGQRGIIISQPPSQPTAYFEIHLGTCQKYILSVTIGQILTKFQTQVPSGSLVVLIQSFYIYIFDGNLGFNLYTYISAKQILISPFET